MSTSAVSSVVLGGSSQSIWALFNQYQMYLVLPFLNGYLPPTFVDFLNAFSFSFFNFKFLKFLQPSFVDEIISDIDYVHPYEEYRDNNFESGSFLINQLQLIVTLVELAMLHLAFLLFLKLFDWDIKNWLFVFVKNYLKNMLHFQIYIRLAIEAYLFAFLAAFSEFYRFKDAGSHLFSYAFSCLCSFLLLGFGAFILIFYLMFKKHIDHPYVKELFAEFKDILSAKIYFFTFILRRSFMVFIFVLMREVDIYVKLSVYTTLHFCNLIYLSRTRPFNEKLDNIIEILNEVLYITICILMSLIQEQPKSLNWFDKLMIGVIIVNTIIISTLVFTFFIINLVKSKVLNRHI